MIVRMVSVDVGMGDIVQAVVVGEPIVVDDYRIATMVLREPTLVVVQRSGMLVLGPDIAALAQALEPERDMMVTRHSRVDIGWAAVNAALAPKWVPNDWLAVVLAEQQMTPNDSDLIERCHLRMRPYNLVKLLGSEDFDLVAASMMGYFDSRKMDQDF